MLSDLLKATQPGGGTDRILWSVVPSTDDTTLLLPVKTRREGHSYFPFGDWVSGLPINWEL